MGPGKGEILAGEKAVAVAGAPETLVSTSTPARSVTVQAKPSNIGKAKVGNASAQKIELEAGESIALFVLNLKLVYIDVTVNGEGVNYLGVG